MSGVSLLVTSAKLTPDEFLAWERTQSERFHYVRGEVFAMAGGTPRHSHLGARVIMQLGAALRGSTCDVHTTDLRLGLSNDEFVYSDAVVVCRPILLRSGTTDVVTNPSVIVEVLSKSTEAYDRGDKQAAYLAMPSVQSLILVSQRDRRVEVYVRQDGGGFKFDVYTSGTIVLSRLATRIELDVDALYEDAFEIPGEEPTAPR